MISNDCITDMDYYQTYIKSLEASGDYSKNTVQAYSSDLKRFLEFLEGQLGRKPSLVDINSRVITEFLDRENEVGLSASTLHRRKVVLGQFARHLTESDFISQEDFFKVLSWRQKLWKEIYKREVVVISDAEISTLFSTIEKEASPKAYRDAALISLLLETGLPIGRLISLDLSVLDLASRRLVVMDHGTTREVSIEKATAFLDRYLSSGRKEYTQSDSEAALFVSQMGGRISRQGVWQLIKEWGERAGLDAAISPRNLRNTKVREMVRSGYSTAEIQKKLGHSNRYSTRALLRKINRKEKNRKRSKS